MADYLQHHAERAEVELKWFGAPHLSVEDAIERAALSLFPSSTTGKLILHDHQRRLGRRLTVAIATLLGLLSSRISHAQTFEALHAQISDALSNNPGVGPLAIYDISQRIGARLGLTPKYIYLHCGSRLGAAALGIRGVDRAPKCAFPAALQVLTPAQLEDLLCIYKSELKALTN